MKILDNLKRKIIENTLDSAKDILDEKTKPSREAIKTLVGIGVTITIAIIVTRKERGSNERVQVVINNFYF